MYILTRLNEIIAYNTHGYIPVGNTAICPTSGECYDDALIVSVDCVPTDIDFYDYHYIDGKFVKGKAKSEVREINNNKRLDFWVGTQAEYDALTQKADNCFYIITDDAPEVDYIMENALAVEANPLTPTIYWTYRKMANGLVEIWGTSEAFKLSLFKYFTINLPLTLKEAPIHIDYGLNLNLGLTETADENSYKGIRVLTRFALNDRINVYFGNDSGKIFDEFKFSIKIVGNWK